MTLKTIAEEIAAKVEWLEQNNGKRIHKDWLVTAVVSDHDDITGEDRDFALCCVNYAIQQSVDRYFRSVRQAEMEEGVDETLLLPGFERLQKRYTFTDETGAQVVVMLQDMTDVEIDAKATSHRQMGDGHYKHADELLRYKAERRRPQAAGE